MINFIIISIGVIAIDPGKLDLTELTMVIDASKNNVPVWMLSEDKLWVHGNEKPKVYGLDLNLLPEGSNVGMMVNYVGELHYYLNGQDKGCAYTGIPESKDFFNFQVVNPCAPIVFTCKHFVH